MSKKTLWKALTLALPAVAILRFLSSIVFIIMLGTPGTWLIENDLCEDMSPVCQHESLLLAIKGFTNRWLWLLALISMVTLIPGIILRVMGSKEEKLATEVSDNNAKNLQKPWKPLPPTPEIQIIRKWSRTYTYKISETGELILFVHPLHRRRAFMCDGLVAIGTILGIAIIGIIITYFIVITKQGWTLIPFAFMRLWVGVVVYIIFYLYYSTKHSMSLGKKRNGFMIYNDDGVTHPSTVKMFFRSLCSLIFGNIKWLQILGVFAWFNTERRMPWDYLCKTTAVYYRWTMYDWVKNELMK